MSKTYYVDASSGSDHNTGTSASAPLHSLAAVAALKLAPGDTVLFARGETFDGQLTIKYSGSASSAITYGAYGQGAAPIITGADTGINGSNSHYIVVKDLTVANTGGNAIFAREAIHWTVDNVTVQNTGSSAKSGSISFQAGTDITIQNSTVSGVKGDGILVDGSKGVTIRNNHVSGVVGHDSDSVQVTNSTNVAITGNHLEMSAHTDSTKGNVLVNMSDHVTVDDNVLVGGAYGASVNSNNVTIAGNEVSGQTGYSWNFGIGIGEAWSVQNYDIHDNYVHDVKYGVSITGSGANSVTRANIGVHDNTFDNVIGAALNVDRPASGSFWNNQISTNSPAERVAGSVVASGNFHLGSYTLFLGAAPQAVADQVHLGMQAATVSGNVLTNDSGHEGAHLAVSQLGGKAVGDSLDLAGKYGSVHINDDGSFVYTVNQSAMSSTAKPVVDVFSYLVSDGQRTGTATLSVDLDARLKLTAVNDSKGVAANGIATGSVFTNDTHREGDVLTLRTVDSTKIAPTPTKIAGDYGTLSIMANGSYTYTLDAHKVGAGGGVLHDVFMYKVSDSLTQDSASLNISIDPHLLNASLHTDFHM